MDVRVTPSARRHLLEEVVRLRELDLNRAIALVEGVEARLVGGAVGGVVGGGGARGAPPADADVALRMYTRTRGDVLWVLAVWTEGDAVAGDQAG